MILFVQCHQIISKKEVKLTPFSGHLSFCIHILPLLLSGPRADGSSSGTVFAEEPTQDKETTIAYYSLKNGQ